MPGRLSRLLSDRAERGSADPRAFVDDCFRRLLDRPADAQGLATFVAMLEAGTPPAEVVISIATSAEYRERLLLTGLPRRRRPDHYRLVVDVSGTSPFLAFDAPEPADFDWLERQIIDDGYYERGNVWSLEPDDDKRVMGALLASLEPQHALEIGCASGTVLGVLAGHGVRAEGVEISRMAYERAVPEIRHRIHVGDLLDLDLPSDFDMVFGLDVFEHLNPNRFDQYAKALRARLRPGGWFVANIPAFGDDEVFGHVFPVYFSEWDADVAAGRPFRVMHCDDDGYPMNGHLIWAHTDWWVEQFEAVGLRRQPAVERGIQERFADHFRVAPARKSLYVFRADA